MTCATSLSIPIYTKFSGAKEKESEGQKQYLEEIVTENFPKLTETNKQTCMYSTHTGS